MDLVKKIKTQHLIVRPFQDKDKEAFLDFMLDENATKFVTFTKEQKTRDGATALFDFVLQSYVSSELVHSYAIVLPADDFIGSCGISKLYENKEIYECYYAVLPKYWGRGFATEATKALLYYYFNHADITEIRAYINPDNYGGEMVARKIGMKFNGTQKHPQSGVASKEYSITNSDFIK